MLNERELENRVERVPAAPGQLLVLRVYNASSTFESQWREIALREATQNGCVFLRLHRDIDTREQYITFDLWDSRSALTEAIRTLANDSVYPLQGETRQTFLRLKHDVSGATKHSNDIISGQVASVRQFYLKVGSEGEFEHLWEESARYEARGSKCLYKRLYRSLNMPTYYISYSVWADRHAPDEAASHHSHYQQNHNPYPLVRAVTRWTLEVVDQVMSAGAGKEEL